MPSGLEDRVGEDLVGEAARAAQRDGLVAAAGLEAHVGAVAVEVLALAGEADHRVPELLVVLRPGRQRAVVDLHVAGRQHDPRRALGRQVGLRQQRQGRVDDLGQVARGRAQLARDALQLGGPEQLARLGDPRERRVDGGGRLADAGQDLAREGARVGEGGVQRVQRAVGVLQRRPEQADRGAQVGGLRCGRGHRRVEVRDEVLELILVAPQALGRAAQPVDEAGQVVVLGPQEGVGHDRGPLQRALAVADGVVERLGRALAARAGVGAGVLRLGRLVGQARPQPFEGLLQVGPRVALQRAQHLVELHRRRGLGERDRVAVVDGRRRRRARRDVDEEVALQEDPRADLHHGVLVDRQALVRDLHRHDGGVAAGLALDLGDLADVDAGDAHRGVLADRVRRLEDRLDPEAVRERHVLGEAEEDADARDDEHHEADEEGARARAVLARHALVVGSAASEHHCSGFVVSVLAGWVPGVFPMTCLPTAKGSLPASHSLGWPGDAVFGIGVAVQVVVLLARDAAVGGRRRRAALVVGALRRGDDDEALGRAVGVADAEQAGDVAEPQRRVVADRLDRRQVGDRRRQDRHRCSSGRARRG